MNKKKLQRNLQQLVRIKSLPGEEKEISEFVEQELTNQGIYHEKDEFFNILVKVGSGRPILLINSHLDTVPAGKGWKYDPFAGKILNGKVYGRGSSDNKSGVASMLELARIFKKKAKGKLIFVFTTREEGKKNGSRKKLTNKLKQIKPDAGISLDCASLGKKKVTIFRGCKGIRNFDILIKGKLWHSSEPEKGINSIYRAMKLVKAVRKARFPKISRPAVKAFANVTKINTNGWPTKIPDRCQLTINYRALPKESLTEMDKRIRRILKKSLKKDYDFFPKAGNEGFLLDENNPIVKSATKACKKPELQIAKGWFDAAWLTKLGIPSIGLGTATEGQAHTPDEYEEVSILVKATKIVSKVIRNF